MSVALSSIEPYQVGENCTIVTRRKYQPPGGTGAVFSHGFGFGGLQVLDPVGSSARLLADRGVPVIAPDLGGNSWASPAGMTRFGQSIPYLRVQTGVTGKVAIIGASMGAFVALRFAIQNPTLVSCLALIIPCVDPVDVRNFNRGGAAASINTAWPVPAALVAASPAASPASWAQFPMRLWYSTNDPVCLPATVTAFADGAGATAIPFGAAGHDVTGLAAGDVADYVAEEVAS